jgi:hypothetical protein
MPASFAVELDTVAPDVTIQSVIREDATIRVFYLVTEPGDVVAFVEDDHNVVWPLVDLGGEVSGPLPDSATGLLTFVARDDVWNATTVEGRLDVTREHGTVISIARFTRQEGDPGGVEGGSPGHLGGPSPGHVERRGPGHLEW